VSQPPSGPPPEGPPPPEPSDDAPYGADPPGGPAQGGWQPAYGPEQYGPPQYGPGPQQYGPQPYGPPPYGSQSWGPYGGQPPYGAPYVPPPPAGRSGRGLLIALVGGFVVLAICVAVTAVLVRRDDRLGTPVALPPGVTATTAPDGSVTMVRSGVGSPLVDVYEDFQCPVCKEFHRVNDATLKNLAGQGRAKVVYHPIVIFSAEPLAGNSLRASAAAHCVDDGPGWLTFQDQLYAHQPPEGASGFSVSDLLSYGRVAGITGSTFEGCVREQKYTPQVRQESQAAIGGGVNGTPTVKVNGTALPTNETLSAEGLRNAVVAAR
jgi:protein-disulfide isomerase